MTEVIDRALWNVLRPQGDPAEATVTVRASGVDIEGTDGDFFVSVAPHDDGIDVRVGDVQLVVKGKRLALMQLHPPYPIQRWTVLWEGNLAPAPIESQGSTT